MPLAWGVALLSPWICLVAAQRGPAYFLVALWLTGATFVWGIRVRSRARFHDCTVTSKGVRTGRWVILASSAIMGGGAIVPRRDGTFAIAVLRCTRVVEAAPVILVAATREDAKAAARALDLERA